MQDKDHFVQGHSTSKSNTSMIKGKPGSHGRNLFIRSRFEIKSGSLNNVTPVIQRWRNIIAIVELRGAICKNN